MRYASPSFLLGSPDLARIFWEVRKSWLGVLGKSVQRRALGVRWNCSSGLEREEARGVKSLCESEGCTR